MHVDDALRSAPVGLIDYVMIDSDYNGEFVCRELAEDPGNEMVIIAPGRVKLVAVDVFGREYDGGVL